MTVMMMMARSCCVEEIRGHPFQEASDERRGR